MNALVLAALTGSALGLALVAAFAARLAAPQPRLSDAIEVLDDDLGPRIDPAAGADRLGAWLQHRWRRPVGAETERRLRLAGRSVNRHFTYKVFFALAGVALPILGGTALIITVGFAPLIPAGLGLVLGVAGFFLPDLLLARGAPATTESATEALLTYFDLVTLERLANLSGSQALRSAAEVSDANVFGSIREALDQARLEQRPPYADLKRLSEELGLPAMRDIAEVMAMDEAGASLASALRARVRELRGAHLTRAKIDAAAVSERMAFFMVIPALVFAGFFLVPPVLRLLGG